MTKDQITEQSNRIFPILHYLHENGEFDNVIKDIKSKLNKMAKAKKKQVKMVKAADIAPCDPGYTRDAHGNCVKDPLPPDPTHQ